VITGILVVAGGLGLFLYLTQRSVAKDEQAAPERGLACVHLQEAARAYDSGDRTALDEAIKRAAEVAEDTLQKSGQVFGEPERIALELELAANPDAKHVRRLLDIGLRDCQSLETP
jgi:hypothetical protein